MSQFALTKWTLAGLLALTLLGAYFRFSGLAEQGLISSDAAMYARQARFFHSLTWPGVSDLGLSIDETPGEAVSRGTTRAQALVESWNQQADDFYEKPSFGHAWAVAMVMAVSGLSPELAASLTTAAADTASIFLVFIIATEILDSAAGLIAAALMAVSRYSSFYARSGMAESDSILLLLLGLYCYLRWRRQERQDLPRTFALGLIWGAAALVQYRWLPAMGCFLLLEAGFGWQGGLSVRAKRLATCVAGIVFVLVIAELPFYAMLVVSNLAGTPLVGIHTELTNLALVLLKNRSLFDTAPGLQFLPAFAFYFFANDGWLPLLGLSAGLWFAAREPGGHRVLLRYLGAHLLLMPMHDMYVARSFAALVPVCLVIAGCGLARLAQLVPARSWAAAVIIVTITIAGAPRAEALVGCRSGIPGAAKALASLDPGSQVVFPDAELAQAAYRFYAPAIHAGVAADLAGVNDLVAKGFRWVVADLSPYDVKGAGNSGWNQVRQQLKNADGPKQTFAHMDGCWSNLMFEGHRPLPEAIALWREYGDRAPHEIEIYEVTVAGQ